MLTLEQVEYALKNGDALHGEQWLELCRLAKLALTPPQDVAWIVEEWRAKLARATGDQNYTLAHKDNISKLLDCVTSLSARNRGLEEENAEQAEMIKVLIEENEI